MQICNFSAKKENVTNDCVWCYLCFNLSWGCSYASVEMFD